MLGLDLATGSSASSPEISIVVPLKNEEGNIPLLESRLSSALKDFDFEVIFVDDGSTDGSLRLMKETGARNPRFRTVSLSRNFGHQVALTVGLEYSKGQAVVVIDGDLQDPPEVIPEMVAKWREGYDVVFGQRISRKGESIMKKATASAFYRLMTRLTHFSIPVDTGDFRLVSRRVVQAFLAMPERHRFVRGMFSWIGFRQTGVRYVREQRQYGVTNYTYRKMIRLAFDGITSFSYVPLKLASYVGFLSAFFGFLLILYSLYQKFYGLDTMRGWASLSVMVLFLGGIQLVMIGMLGEYVGRMHDEQKHRPLYIVKDRFNF
jgi:dolichol-phosphate mannosyltransferase